MAENLNRSLEFERWRRRMAHAFSGASNWRLCFSATYRDWPIAFGFRTVNATTRAANDNERDIWR